MLCGPQVEKHCAKRTVIKVCAIKDTREDFCATEIGGANLDDSSQSGPPNFWTFKPLELDGSNFWNGKILKIN